MSYTPNTWQERQGSGLNRFQDQNGNLYEFTAVPTEVTQAGTPFSATWMNHIEQGIADAVPSEEKGTANGIATLDASGKLTQMPTASDVGAVATSFLGQTLWSGTWNSGSITVEGFANYHLFEIQLGTQIKCIGIRFSASLVQFYGMSAHDALMNTYAGTFSVSGNTLTWGRANGLSHTVSGNHSALYTYSITQINGII